MDLKLRGKRALVFGSSAGLGRAIAQELIQEGTRVFLCARNLNKLQQTAQQIKAEGFVVGDLSQPGEARRVTSEAMQFLGGLDILVMNTGGPNKGHFMDISSEQWQMDFQSLWMSFVESAQESLQSMKDQKYGRILVVTSLAAKEPLAALTTSNGLRAGLAGLAKSLANESAPFGVTVNLLLPGYTNTDRLKELKLSEERIKQMVPAGRLGEPEELASLACFLASPRASYITGQSIAVDGGVLRGHY